LVGTLFALAILHGLSVNPMKIRRICFETLAVGTAIACACALLIAMLAVVTSTLAQPVSAEDAANIAPPQATESAPAQPVPVPTALTQTQTFEGMVTCLKCGAKHSAALGRNASDCARRCVRSGSTFALVDGERTYALQGDLMAIKKVAGERATLVGSLSGNTIQVASVVAETELR
jgi:curli biogenesis system outer membrane secretion channel CsgG